MDRSLKTKHGLVKFPAFLPVTTFGSKFPLDDVVRPHLKRFSNAIMVSHYYAQNMPKKMDLPVFIDSGGFASLLKNSKIIDNGDTVSIKNADGTKIEPGKVLAFQEKNADIGATLDFIIPLGIGTVEAERRQEMTIRNALWAISKRKNKHFKLYASLQAWDSESALRIAGKLAPHSFDGFALGGMVPRISQPETILSIVKAVRSAIGERPLHVFGIGQPRVIKTLFDAGVDSVDSSSFVQQAAGKKYLQPKTGTYVEMEKMDTPHDLCDCRVCRTFDRNYFLLEGELNNMALALHNIAATQTYLFGKAADE